MGRLTDASSVWVLKRILAGQSPIRLITFGERNSAYVLDGDDFTSADMIPTEAATIVTLDPTVDEIGDMADAVVYSRSAPTASWVADPPLDEADIRRSIRKADSGLLGEQDAARTQLGPIKRRLGPDGEPLLTYLIEEFERVGASGRAWILRRLYDFAEHDRRVITLAVGALSDRSEHVQLQAFKLIDAAGGLDPDDPLMAQATALVSRESVRGRQLDALKLGRSNAMVPGDTTLGWNVADWRAANRGSRRAGSRRS